MSKEIYKDVKGYEGYYQVSNYGNVKSLNRNTKNQYKKEFVIKPCVSGNGYLRVCFNKNGSQTSKTVHQLVAIAFLNHTPNKYVLVVDHIDENKLNNNLTNLQLITQVENLNKSIDKTKTSSKYKGVSWVKRDKKWRAQIRVEGKIKSIGYFTDEYTAHLAYKTAVELNEKEELLKELSNEINTYE